jgi:hypothetical protein
LSQRRDLPKRCKNHTPACGTAGWQKCGFEHRENKEKTKRQRDFFAADDRLGKVAYNRPVGQEDERDEIWGTGTENILSD